MMKPRYSELATELLARHARRDDEDGRPQAAPVDPGSRALAIAALERALGEKRRRTQRRRWMLGSGLAAAVAAAFVVRLISAGSHAPSQVEARAGATEAPVAPLAVFARSVGDGASPVTVTRAGQTSTLTEGAPLLAGSRVSAPAVHVGGKPTHMILAFSTGTEIGLLPEADVMILKEDATQELELSHGAMTAQVAKLTPAQRFLVHTPDAEVEVRGTAFRVAVVPPDPQCGSGTLTRVDVTEGVVVVRRGGVESRVAKGETWPSGCNAAGAPGATAINPAIDGTPEAAEPVRPARSLRGTDAPRPASRSSNASSLGAQNEMFADAIAAKRAGRVADAIGGFDQLLTTYPASPLAESASVERLRLLRGRDPRALAAAREYLTRFPDGFARAEAEAVLAEKP